MSLKIKFIFVGRTKDKNITELEQKYVKLISKSCQPLLEICKDDIDPLTRIDDREYLILLDEIWEQYSSINFWAKLKKIIDSSSKMVFMIWWAYWASEELRKRANLILSFSKMTFTHEMIRIILFEQIFRAFTIIENRSYHK